MWESNSSIIFVCSKTVKLNLSSEIKLKNDTYRLQKSAGVEQENDFSHPCQLQSINSAFYEVPKFQNKKISICMHLNQSQSTTSWQSGNMELKIIKSKENVIMIRCRNKWKNWNLISNDILEAVEKVRDLNLLWTRIDGFCCSTTFTLSSHLN